MGENMADDVNKIHEKWRAQVLKGLLEFYVLLYIKEYQPTHGYEIIQALRKALPLTAEIADGPVYAVLSRLSKEELLDQETQVISGRRRKHFRLNTQGELFLGLVSKDWKHLADLTARIQKAE